MTTRSGLILTENFRPSRGLRKTGAEVSSPPRLAAQQRLGLRPRRSILLAQAALMFLLFVSFEASAIVFTVNTRDDLPDQVVGDGLCWTGNYVSTGGPFGVRECSLRAAMQEAGATAAADTIEFGSLLPVDLYGTIVFAVNTELPQVYETLTIDGTTAPSYDLNDPDAVPVVVIDGGPITGNNGTGLSFWEADFSVVRGLAIVDFPGTGLSIAFCDYSVIQGNHIGLERGSLVRGNGFVSDGSPAALSVVGSDSVTVGHSFERVAGFIGSGNVISGNRFEGIIVSGANVKIAGNKIGTDRFGNAVSGGGGNYGNGGWGVLVAAAPSIQIGRVETLLSGVRVASGNTIAGNGFGGVRFYSGEAGMALYANKIGIGSDGTTALGNQAGPGIRVYGNDVTIGEEGVGANVISGNQGNGIEIPDFGTLVSEGLHIVGNIIGLSAAGDAIVPNLGAGIAIFDGDTTEISLNTIGGNAHGIQVNGLGHDIHNNYIGTNASGAALGNVGDGIRIEAAFDTTVGSNVVATADQLGARKNVIAFNGEAGVSLPAAPSPSDPVGLFNAIRGNQMYSNGGLAVDLGVTGPNGNDSEDDDSGRNNLQNSPRMDPDFTELNTGSGDVAVRYLVDSAVTEAAYPITIDFYQAAPGEDEPLHWLGSSLYDASDAMNYRDVTFTPASAVSELDSIVAIATDDENNSSEVSSVVPLPEPGLGTALLCGVIGLARMGSYRGRQCA